MNLKVKDFDDCVLRLLADLYGRRTAAKTWQGKLELVLRQVPETPFQEACAVPCVFVDQYTGGVIMHRVDHIRGTGPAEFCQNVMDYLTTQLWVGWGLLETEGCVGKFLKRTKHRFGACVITEPSGRHIDRMLDMLDLTAKGGTSSVPGGKADLMNSAELEGDAFSHYRSCVGLTM